jgi:hypothetical protein
MEESIKARMKGRTHQVHRKHRWEAHNDPLTNVRGSETGEPATGREKAEDEENKLGKRREKGGD